MGFSQGVGVALSYLMDQDPSDSPFKFAVILSTIARLSPDPNYCSDFITGLTAKDYEILKNFPFGIDDDDYTALSPPQPGRATFLRTLGLLMSTRRENGLIDPHGDPYINSLKAPVTDEPASSLANVPRMFNTSLVRPSQLIQIPTVHVTGRKDNAVIVSLSQSMVTLCEPGLMRRMTHNGGHGPPCSTRDIKALVKNVEWALQKGTMLANTV